LDGPDRRRTHVLAGACVPIRMFGRLGPSGRLAMGPGCRGSATTTRRQPLNRLPGLDPEGSHPEQNVATERRRVVSR
jgi:hypothetical protein